MSLLITVVTLGLFQLATPVLEPAPEPPAAASDEPAAESSRLRIAVLTDLNERYGDTHHRDTVYAAVDRVVAWRPDLVLVPGDMVAGQRPGLDYTAMWEAFHAAVTEPLNALPMAICPGNHDASAYERYAAERDVYRDQWRDRARPDRFAAIEMVDDAHYPFRYAFTIGPALVIALDATRRHALEDGDQLDWLEAQLRAADEARHPVRILFGHFPLYPFTEGRERDYLLADAEVRARFERMVADYGVDLYVSGHHHAYYPGRHEASGLLTVSAGILGGGPRPLLGEGRTIEDIEDPTERVLVWIEVDASGVVRVDGFRGPSFAVGDRIATDELPARVGFDDLAIVRFEARDPGR